MADVSEQRARSVAEDLAERYLGSSEHSFKVPEGGDSNYSFLVDQEIVFKIEKNHKWIKICVENLLY